MACQRGTASIDTRARPLRQGRRFGLQVKTMDEPQVSVLLLLVLLDMVAVLPSVCAPLVSRL